MAIDKIRFYVPVHNVPTEQISVFLSSSSSKLQPKVFVYPFQPQSDIAFSNSFYAKEFNALVFSCTLEDLWRELKQDEADNIPVVILLSSSANYTFGRLQRSFFSKLAGAFGNVIDVFGTGHCLYGCTSCSHEENKIPLYFTRFYNGSLLYTKQSLKEEFHIKAGQKTVLIAPSFGEYSTLSNPEYIEALTSLPEKFPDVKFFVKLHPVSFLSPDHSLHGLPPLQISAVQRLLSSKLTIVPRERLSILPYMDLADVVVAELESSIPFECFFFTPKPILAYVSKDNVAADSQDPHYKALLHVFSDPPAFISLLSCALIDPTPMVRDGGKDFFTSKYGVVTGNEVNLIASTRWKDYKLSKTSVEVDASLFKHPLRSSLEEESDQYGGPLSPWPYILLGELVPSVVVQFQQFSSLHSSQLEAFGFPLHLYARLYIKASQQIFDVGNTFCFTEEGDLVALPEEGIPAEKDVWLLDHAWTTTPSIARSQLESNEALVDRIGAMLNYAAEEEDDEKNEKEQDSEALEREHEKKIRFILDNMERISSKYIIQENDQQEEVTYVVDEVGQAIQQCDEHLEDSQTPPNCHVATFINLLRGGEAFDILWVSSPLEQGDTLFKAHVHS